MHNLIFELIDNEIRKIQAWIKCCENSKLEYAIPEYENKIRYYESCKEILSCSIDLDDISYDKNLKY